MFEPPGFPPEDDNTEDGGGPPDRSQRAKREKTAARVKAYKAAHPELLATQRKAYKTAHREEIRAKSKAYKATHREEIAARNRATQQARLAVFKKTLVINNDAPINVPTPGREIQLHHKKVIVAYALVDADMFDFLNQWTWRALFRKGKTYAGRLGVRPNGKRMTIFLHNIILKVEEGYQVDHRNGNSLDNRRSNLRYATQAQNNQNRAAYIGDRYTSPYKGVSFRPTAKTSPWQAEITAFGRRAYLGVFSSEIEAAKAFDKAARQHHGDFAHLNFPEQE